MILIRIDFKKDGTYFVSSYGVRQMQYNFSFFLLTFFCERPCRLLDGVRAGDWGVLG